MYKYIYNDIYIYIYYEYIIVILLYYIYIVYSTQKSDSIQIIVLS